ncbi:hypothetical protein PMZ80_008421 [Knufia obscura]|uniref:Uncharacterized protein n=2 Tax=Knufia TaxID=430999 RepID=A0AAN8I655_9EURO|nr:hypothetical protein PMZ80_008421 [Knufia obscura]KAK5951306.1 hypothetical protein OHC33_007724 [Knufia fluminis]
MYSQAIVLALVAARAVAIPQGNSCSYNQEYTVTNEERVEGEREQVTGITCVSSSDNYCEISREYSYSVGVTHTVSGSVSGSLDIGKIFSIGAEAGYSYSWSTESATSTTADVQCPAGHYECGLQASPMFIVTTGTVCNIPITDGLFCQETEEICEDYEVRAPSLIGSGPDNQAAEVQFSACVSSCCMQDLTGVLPCEDNWGECYADPVADLPICNPL